MHCSASQPASKPGRPHVHSGTDIWPESTNSSWLSLPRPVEQTEQVGRLLMAVVVTAASVQDRDGAKLLLRSLSGSCKKIRRIWVDGGYRGQLLDWVRGSRDGENTALHMISAFATGSGLRLGQEGTRGKGHEIAGIKALLDTLTLKYRSRPARHSGTGAVRRYVWRRRLG